MPAEHLNKDTFTDLFPERAEALKNRDEKLYQRYIQVALQRRTELQKHRRQHLLEGETQKQWEDFILAVTETEAPNFKEFAEKPETFDADRFKFEILMVPGVHAHTPGAEYGYRGQAMRIQGSESSIYIDAPYAYALLYQNKKGDWESISVVSFLPRFVDDTILVDQVQGDATADEDGPGISNEARRARNKFKIPPEEILYKMVLGLGHRTDMGSVGLRKAVANKWGPVIRKVEAGEDTTYDTLAKKRNLEKRNYLYEYLFEDI